MAWRCSECGCSREEADRRRRRLELPRLKLGAKTCTPACARERAMRWLREYWARVKVRATEPRRGQAWRCSECGRDAFEATRLRRRRGLRDLSSRSRVCSPECAAARELRRYTERHGAPRRSWAGWSHRSRGARSKRGRRA